MAQRLSAVIITLNEERNIARALKSLEGVADEIIVVDSFSSDRTPEIVKNAGAQLAQEVWLGYSMTKNLANSLATGDYILSIDADEALSSELKSEILTQKQKGFSGVYSINRMTNYLGKWIRHSGWFPDWKVRIFPKAETRWIGEFVHEELEFSSPQQTTKLTGILEHYSYYSYADHRARADKYSRLTAQKFHSSGKRVSFLKPYISAIGRFFAMYVLKLGFLDGWKGFRIAQISAASNILKYKELRRITKAGDIHPKTIVISRTDSIGDVALTMPLAGILKKDFPDCKVIFLGNSYTEPVIQCSHFVDEIWKWDDISKMPPGVAIDWLKEKRVDTFIHVFPRKEIAQWAKAAGVPHRIGTSHRLFHFFNCNHRVNFTRKRSALHEAQLNTKLLSPLGVVRDFTLETLSGFAGFDSLPSAPERYRNLFERNKKTVIFHPKSKGSAAEWHIENFVKLANELDANKFNFLFTGTENEGVQFRHLIPKKSNVFDLTGQLTLTEFIGVIQKSAALIAASTGPLHIAGLANITTIGLFPSKKPMHAGRWKPLGIRTIIIEDKNPFVPNQPLAIDYRDVKRLLESL